MTGDQEYLFPELDGPRNGSNRPYQNLFLPRLLAQKANLDESLTGEAQDRAFEIIKKWAALDTSGKLARKKETELQGEFLTEVFGEALGYTLFSEGQEKWNLSPQFQVNGGTADGAIGLFEHDKKVAPRAVIELKGPKTNLDRDRFSGRTAVSQCWDYLNNLPDCPWGIVCNYVSFRIYHRDHTPRAYQLFTLRELQKEDKFRQFYYLFEREGFLSVVRSRRPRVEVLLEESTSQQQKVGNELYASYQASRNELITYLQGKPYNKSLDQAIHITQKLLDRIIFIAFCEDRELLPNNSLHKAFHDLPPFSRVTNPRWQNFLDLFQSIDKGNPAFNIQRFNGGLFDKDEEVDDLILDDSRLHFFETIGKYDFRDEINVDVLGNLFERSVGDIENIQRGGLFGEKFETEERPRMEKSADRKRGGIYYTPPAFTSFITRHTVGKVIDERCRALAKKRDIDPENHVDEEPNPVKAAFWRECLETIRQIKVVDPACGSGAFLISAYKVFYDKYQDVIEHLIYHDGAKNEKLFDLIPDYILNDNLFGVDLNAQAVEITRLALWIRSAQKGKTLADLSKNIVCGNSLVSDKEIDPSALKWDEAFPSVFSRPEGGFDCVIGNPPWERMKLQEREFFDASAPHIASAVSAATRRQLIDDLKTANPDLYERYMQAKDAAEKTLDHVRTSERFPLTGKGDINTYAVFAELAYSIVAPHGRVGLLVPSGIATDHTTKEFFGGLVSGKRLIAIYDFENKAPIFPDVHRSFKITILLFGGKDTKAGSSDFVFFAHTMADLEDKNRHIALTVADFKLLNPNTLTCPIFRSKRDAELTRAIYRRVPVLVDNTRKEGGNPWGIKFFTMFHQTNDAELFNTADKLQTDGFKRDGACWKKGKARLLPLYEAKMIQIYDHRAASVVITEENWMRQGQTGDTSQVQHQNPEFVVEPRWWVAEGSVQETNERFPVHSFIGFKDISSPTNQRTMIAAAIPWSAVTNHFPLVLTDQRPRLNMTLLANLNTIIFDYIARQKIGGITLNFFIVEQLPVFTPDYYAARCPWEKRTTLEKWVSDRVLKLTCTSNDMIPLAEAAGFDPTVHKWNPEERADLMAQLDAAYFLMYGIKRDDVEYVLSTFSGINGSGDTLFGGMGTTDRILRHYDKFTEIAGHSD